MKIYKFNGCGNNFFIIDLSNIQSKNIKELLIDNAYNICKNHEYRPDGILILEKSLTADVFMNIINSDGSIANMCGNGIRCVAHYLFLKNKNKKFYNIDTLSGLKQVTLSKFNNKSCLSKVEIGQAKISDANIYLDLLQRDINFYLVDVGNKHAVFFPDEQILRKKDQIYAYFQNKNELNVEFIQHINNLDIKIRVFERGCGETMACGTGATAVAFTLHKKGYGNNFNIKMPGGILNVEINQNKAILKGPTEFDGLENLCLNKFISSNIEK